jgi:hypothetical protein
VIWTDVLFLIGCAILGAAPTLVALKFGSLKLASLVCFIWFSASALLLFKIGLGPHGFILFAFLPFWGGCFVGLMALLVRNHSNINARIDGIETK